MTKGFKTDLIVTKGFETDLKVTKGFETDFKTVNLVLLGVIAFKRPRQNY